MSLSEVLTRSSSIKNGGNILVFRTLNLIASYGSEEQRLAPNETRVL